MMMGDPVPPSVVEPGGLGYQDRVLDDGLGVEALSISQPSPVLGGDDQPRRPRRGRWLQSVLSLCRRLGLLGPGRQRPTRSPGEAGPPPPSAGTGPAKPTASDREPSTSTRPTRLLAWIDRHLDIYTEVYPEWRRAADVRLARAYLNRAHVAFKQGDAHLARLALTRSLRLAPTRTLAHLAIDPRLLAPDGHGLADPHNGQQRTYAERQARFDERLGPVVIS